MRIYLLVRANDRHVTVNGSIAWDRKNLRYSSQRADTRRIDEDIETADYLFVGYGSRLFPSRFQT